jgi:hypothetical protein
MLRTQQHFDCEWAKIPMSSSLFQHKLFKAGSAAATLNLRWPARCWRLAVSVEDPQLSAWYCVVSDKAQALINHPSDVIIVYQ